MKICNPVGMWAAEGFSGDIGLLLRGDGCGMLRMRFSRIPVRWQCFGGAIRLTGPGGMRFAGSLTETGIAVPHEYLGRLVFVRVG